ncbi:hypothetical protein [Haladaptatus halobius]|uniref:hypothetical protein n=1 Tax=Haladaptatus halobius TaxID=2884875 RepID=UPI001D0ACA35|nr:hypothetical protein [Haladaptatus halobius]
MATSIERALQTMFRIGFIGMVCFFVLFLLYALGGIVALTFMPFHFDYSFLSLRPNPDPVFNILGMLFGIFVCIETFAVIWLTYFGRNVLQYRDTVAILTGFVGLGLEQQSFGIRFP